MLRLVRSFIFVGLLLIHLAILVLWWDSWKHLRLSFFPESTKRLGICSSSGVLVINFGDAAPKALMRRVTETVASIYRNSIEREHWYFDPLAGIKPRRRFAFEMVDIPASISLSAHGSGGLPPPRTRTSFPAYRYLRICFPYWFAAAVSGAVVWPWIGWIAFRRRRARWRDRAGLCPKCGYDMRANPARCSECGHETSPMDGCIVGG